MRVSLALALGLPLSLLAQPAFDDLAGGPGPTAAAAPQARAVPGQDYPSLEFRADPKLMGAKSEVWLTRGGAARMLGTLQQGALASLAGMYSFRAQERGPVLAAVDWQLATFDPGKKFVLYTGDRRTELGRVRQRVLASVGTGLDVYKKGQPAIGYIDEQVGRYPARFAIDPLMYSGWTNKYYVFQDIAWREEQQGRRRRQVEQRTDRFAFVGATVQNFGPAGLFLDPSGKPLMAVKGTWWQSQQIFDLETSRLESEGTVGKTARGVGVLVGVLAGDKDLVDASTSGADDRVRNPTGYLGAFLAGLIYFPEFRAAVGIDLGL